jgi:mRNA interferase RelE/StbE
MRYEIRLSKLAAKQFRALSAPVQLRLKARIDALSLDPGPHGAKALKGVTGLFRIREGDYRVIYQVRDTELLVLVVKIGDRKTIYRRLAGIQ